MEPKIKLEDYKEGHQAVPKTNVMNKIEWALFRIKNTHPQLINNRTNLHRRVAVKLLSLMPWGKYQTRWIRTNRLLFQIISINNI